MMHYKGYLGKAEYDDDAGIFHGEVVNTRDVITFQGATVEELRRAFRDSVDDYLEFCASRGEDPDKPFSGQFITRISPQLHRDVKIAAALAGKSLNAWVGQQLRQAVGRSRSGRSTHGGGPASTPAAKESPRKARTRRRKQASH